ncbi:FecCD family ABC transporter permease [Streptomyces millisiae]|uniref:Iron chelate uptake ABC transporter family permease subunit n=1 Tax=Streptomyces millisiae TaxID=3075542 RepID=A0ABU2LWK3_9ACTN|nr:iron chelate uptake ABC transporter family permease subunit [Streptomyces sp. DSM 44918]MDT0321984.1 iron chelate uptake ABC transporter family permease subunit [Streptomyces sp. DSM 44918]
MESGAPPARVPIARNTRRRTTRRAAGLLVSFGVLALVAAASIAFGARSVPPGDVWHALFAHSGTESDVVIRELRLPRTLLGLLCGAALGLAGAVMQALTRNPLADPGLLGINAGAAAAVVTAISLLGVESLTGYVWFAFLGAAVIGVLVYALGGSRAATPVRLALAGTALSAALHGYTQAVELLDTAALDRMRFWAVGSLAAANGDLVRQVLPFLLAGTLLALLLGRSLNAIALGDDAARSLGAGLGRTRALALLAVTLLCGAATAACGPVVFVGLIVPHLVRALTGPDLRWTLPYAAVLAPVLLLGADVVGRLVARPSELQVGIVTSLIGGPVFVHLVRRGRTAKL